MSAPLAIAHTEASNGWGGQEIRILTEAAGFIARGHRVIVLAADNARILAEAPRYNVPANALPIGRKTLRGVKALAQSLARERVDIVNTHSSTDTWLCALACRWLELRRRHAPALVRTRHVSIPVPNDPATRWLYRRATARIVTTGDTLREQLIRDNGIDPHRIDSVPTGIDAARLEPRNRSDARRELGLPHDVPLLQRIQCPPRGRNRAAEALGERAQIGILVFADEFLDQVRALLVGHGARGKGGSPRNTRKT